MIWEESKLTDGFKLELEINGVGGIIILTVDYSTKKKIRRK